MKRLAFRSRPRLAFLAALTCALALGALAPSAAEAQPFGSWYQGDGTLQYISIPHHSSLNPASAITVEAWVYFHSISGCRSIAGKGFTQTWWVGVCATGGGNGVLRTYLNGIQADGGVLTSGVWTHVALTYTGSHRRHYINGELVQTYVQAGLLASNGADVHIASDPHFLVSPDGRIDEVRLWSVARSLSQLRSTINKRITTPQPGLVAVWALNGSGNDVVGARDGSLVNTPPFFTFAIIGDCAGSSATTLCLNDRYRVRAWWRTSAAPGSPVDGQATTVAFTAPDSGLFWFFSSSNWEVMVKVLNACGLNNRYWVFSAATTNVFYRMEVFDGGSGVQKIYFNYPGPPAPAVTDTDAFATCP